MDRRPISSLGKLVLVAAIAALAAATAEAAVLMDMRFNSNPGQIQPAVGWDGTTVAAGGSIATGLDLTGLMKINGDFVAQNTASVFHVDNWHTTNNMTTTYVGMALGAESGYAFDLTGAGASFSTQLHQHPSNASDMFNAVELRINGTSFGNQTYTPAGGVQTLTWNLSSSGLSGLTTADFRLYFTGANNTANNNHGPEWAQADGAFVQVNGVVNVVPEPATAILGIGVVSGGFVLSRRLRRRTCSKVC